MLRGVSGCGVLPGTGVVRAAVLPEPPRRGSPSPQAVFISRSPVRSLSFSRFGRARRGQRRRAVSPWRWRPPERGLCAPSAARAPRAGSRRRPGAAATLRAPPGRCRPASTGPGGTGRPATPPGSGRTWRGGGCAGTVPSTRPASPKRPLVPPAGSSAAASTSRVRGPGRASPAPGGAARGCRRAGREATRGAKFLHRPSLGVKTRISVGRRREEASQELRNAGNGEQIRSWDNPG